MEHTRDHIIFFMAQKMYFLEQNGNREVFNRLVAHFEQIDLDELLDYLTRYYALDVERSWTISTSAKGARVHLEEEALPIQACVP